MGTATQTPRPFIGIHFRCCNVYQRIYRRSDGAAYEGRCPKCLRAVRATVGPGGVSQRFFNAE
jgi:hypothetical protein